MKEDRVWKLNWRLSFYYRIPVVQKCLKISLKLLQPLQSLLNIPSALTGFGFIGSRCDVTVDSYNVVIKASRHFVLLINSIVFCETNHDITIKITNNSWLVATCHLQTCHNLLKQLAASLWITSFDNQLAKTLLTKCNRRVVNKLPEAMQTHPDIGLL